VDALSDQEARVAAPGGRGATIREAAAELFLSKTVEFHLAHIYRKLGIRSRSSPPSWPRGS